MLDVGLEVLNIAFLGIIAYDVFPPDNTFAEYGERLDDEYAALLEQENKLKKDKTINEEVQLHKLEKIGSRLTEIDNTLKYGDYQDAE